LPWKAPVAEEGFNPNKSKVSNDTMEHWKNSTITGDLRQIPGIGPAAVEKLKAESITNTFQLVGKYLFMKGPDEESLKYPAVHNDKFWFWLKNIGIVSHRSAIVVALGEKMSQTFPGIYDPTLYEEPDDEDE
jgi:hypothetical protein